MKNEVRKLNKKKVNTPAVMAPSNLCYLVIMGSVAYGLSTDESDWDIYGFSVPPKDVVFPHLKGEIPGFGRHIKRFEQWQEHHIYDADIKRNYDFAVYSIIKYFQLVMENNPNMIDSLFVPQRCVIHSTQLGNLVRENRKLFFTQRKLV